MGRGRPSKNISRAHHINHSAASFSWLVKIYCALLTHSNWFTQRWSELLDLSRTYFNFVLNWIPIISFCLMSDGTKPQQFQEMHLGCNLTFKLFWNIRIMTNTYDVYMCICVKNSHSTKVSVKPSKAWTIENSFEQTILFVISFVRGGTLGECRITEASRSLL